MKKLLITSSVVLATCVSLVGCGSDKDTTAPTSQETQQAATQNTDEQSQTEDKSFPLVPEQKLVNRTETFFENQFGKIVFLGENQTTTPGVYAFRFEGGIPVDPDRLHLNGVSDTGVEVSDIELTSQVVYPDGIVAFYTITDEEQKANKLLRLDASISTGEDTEHNKTFNLDPSKKDELTLPAVKDFKEKTVDTNITVEDNDKKIEFNQIIIDPLHAVKLKGKITYKNDVEEGTDAKAMLLNTNRSYEFKEKKDKFFAGIGKDFEYELKFDGVTPVDNILDINLYGLRTTMDIVTGKEVSSPEIKLSDLQLLDENLEDSKSWELKLNSIFDSNPNSIYFSGSSYNPDDEKGKWGYLKFVPGKKYKELSFDVALAPESSSENEITAPVTISIYNQDYSHYDDAASNVKPVKTITVTKQSQNVTVDLTDAQYVTMKMYTDISTEEDGYGEVLIKNAVLK